MSYARVRRAPRATRRALHPSRPLPLTLRTLLGAYWCKQREHRAKRVQASHSAQRQQHANRAKGLALPRSRPRLLNYWITVYELKEFH